MNPEYLGDSVYVELDASGDYMKLYLDNGTGPRSEIYINSDVWAKLQSWVERMRNEQNNPR